MSNTPLGFFPEVFTLNIEDFIPIFEETRPP
jgi:hypothetical protein